MFKNATGLEQFETKSISRRKVDEQDKDKMTIQVKNDGDVKQLIVVLEPSDLMQAMKLQIDQIKDKAANTNYKWEIFDIKQEIGAGTFGQVYASLDQKTQKKYALKFIGYDDESDMDPEFKAAVKEIVIMQTLSQQPCQGLLRIFDVYPCIKEDNKYLVIVMELCDCNLMELLKVRIEEGKSKWSDEELLYILHQLVEGFLIMKKKNITHRDIKPQNILYSSQDRSYKIADLGGAKFLKPKKDNYRSEENTVRGSPAYWARKLYHPQLAEIYYFCDLQKDRDGRFFVGKQHLPYDPYISDVYSVGITFLLMKKLQPRIDRESLKTEVEMLKKLKQPTFLDSVLVRMLEYDDNKRITFDDLYELVGQASESFKQPNEDVFVNCLRTQQDKKQQNLSNNDLMQREIKLAQAYEKLNMIEHAKTHFDYALKYANKTSNDQIKADILNSLGTVNCDLEYYEESEKYFQESVLLYKKINGEKHSSVADAINNIGIVKRKKGEYDKAIKFYEQAYQIKESVSDENNLGGAVILGNIALAHKKLGNYNEAIKYFKNSLQIKKLLCGQNSPILCSTYDNLARVFYLKQQFDQAISCFNITSEIYRKNYQSNKSRLGDSTYELALCYQKIGQIKDAIKACEESYNIRKCLHGQFAKQTVKTLELLSQCYLEDGQYQRAIENYTKLKQWYLDNQIKFQQLEEKFDNLADIVKNLGTGFMEMQQYEQALQHYQDGEIYLQKRIKDYKRDESTRLSKIYYNIGLTYRKKKDFKKAQEYYNKAINQIQTSQNSADWITLGDLYNNLGVLFGSQDDYIKAREQFQISHDYYKQALGPNHQLSQSVDSNIREIDKYLSSLAKQ